MKTSEKIEQLKRAIATGLSAGVNRLSLKNRKRLLLFTGCMVVGLCLYIAITPFRRADAVFVIIPKDHIPATIVPPEPLFSVDDITMLRQFKQMMDSLKIYDSKTYTEILGDRQGLLDSVEMLIQLYQ